MFNTYWRQPLDPQRKYKKEGRRILEYFAGR
jgi:hypothetical protein